MLNKKAIVKEKKIEGLISFYEIFADEINNKVVCNRLLFLLLSKNKTLIIY